MSLDSVIRQAVADGLVDAGDGSYVTSFDTDETAEVVIDRVTQRVLASLEDMGPSPVGRLYRLVVPTDKPYCRDEQVEAEFNGVWRAGKVTRLTDTGYYVVYYDEPFLFEGQTVTHGHLPPHRIRRPLYRKATK